MNNVFSYGKCITLGINCELLWKTSVLCFIKSIPSAFCKLQLELEEGKKIN